jgi:hypothetical protein
MRSLRNLVVGFSLGIVSTATLAWALEVKIPPRITAKANVVVDEVGTALFGATPGKVQVVNLPSSTEVASGVIKDANGTIVGNVSRPFSPGDSIFIARSVGNVGFELVASQFSVQAPGTGSINFYYEAADCMGTPYSPGGGGGFYPAVVPGPAGLVYYLSGPPTPRDINSYRLASDPSAHCTVNLYPQLYVYPVAPFDTTQFAPPFHFEG